MQEIVSKLPDLPSSNDEFWDGLKVQAINRPIPICETHTKERWMQHIGYVQDGIGSISCKYCPWGTRLPGYVRLIDEKIVDLRSINNSTSADTETPQV